MDERRYLQAVSLGKWLISRIYKELSLKMGEGPEKDIFRKIYRWTTEALKIFDISNHQRNVNPKP